MWQSGRDALKPIFGIYRNLFASALHGEKGFRVMHIIFFYIPPPPQTG